MTWADRAALARARERLTERYPGETVEIIETFDIAHIGWEADYQGALIEQTEAVLARYRTLGGLFGSALFEAQQKHHHRRLVSVVPAKAGRKADEGMEPGPR